MTALKAIGLTSPTTQESGRFFFGYSFAEGEVPAGQFLHLDTPAYSATINNTWPDGSACLAVFTGTTPFTANVEKQINIVSRSYAPTSAALPALTAADIAASGASASVQFSSIGTSTLASATLVQTHYSDSQMVCCEYRGKAGVSGAAAKLSAQYFVWLFSDGKRFMRVTPWNGFAFDGAVQQDYVPTVTIDGVVVFDNAGAIYHHSANTWYTLTRWSSGSAITPRHDTTKLIESGLFPNYTKDIPQQANRNYLASISKYTPGARLGYSEQMGSTGAQDQIGVLPMWEAMYFVNRAEEVAYDAVVAGANAIGTYSAFHTDPTTFRPIKLSDYPTHTQYGAGQGGNGNYGSIAQDGTTQYVYEIAHHPGAGYLAAVITGDPFYMQLCQYIANTCYLAITGLAGSGVNRIVGQQTRGVAWTIRSIANAARTCPTSQSALYEHNAWFSNTVVAYSDLSDTWAGVGGFKVGLINEYSYYGSNGSNAAGVAFWQYDFLMMSLGQAISMKVGTTTGRTKALNFMSYLSNSVKWRSDATYYTYPANYYYVIPKSTPIGDTSPLLAANANPSSVTDIFSLNLTSDELATLGDNILHSGGSTGTGAGSYWDQFMCAVAYCVDNNFPGAAAGLARIQGASNYTATLGGDSRAMTPVFAISPRSVGHAPTFQAIDNDIKDNTEVRILCGRLQQGSGFVSGKIWGLRTKPVIVVVPPVPVIPVPIIQKTFVALDLLVPDGATKVSLKMTLLGGAEQTQEIEIPQFCSKVEISLQGN